MEENATIQIPELGELRYDGEMDNHEIDVPSRFGVIKITLECEDELSADELVAEIRTFCSNLDSILEKAFKEIVDTMLPLKNESWLDDDEAPISADELLQATQSGEISISLCQGGLAEMFFEDGDFFGGHWIVVWHREDGVVEEAHLAG
ncbi:MAG: hypothetical protein B0A82_21475 [Alkalinema sp. CACIAM 70d]|nr:MAG: hypothetical protein B0A82_21475 [Alkalinema sp. CACIAM 70d]